MFILTLAKIRKNMSTHISVSSETQEEIVRKCAVEAHGGGV